MEEENQSDEEFQNLEYQTTGRLFITRAADKISSAQPIIKLSPPSGVIAPIILIPDRAITYKLPENIRIPTEINILVTVKRRDGQLPCIKPIIINNKAWYI